MQRCVKRKSPGEILPDAYVGESEDVLLGESQPLSELLLVKSAGSSDAAAIDMSRSSSGRNQSIHQLETEHLNVIVNVDVISPDRVRNVARLW